MIESLTIKQVEKISKALGDPYRLKIMETISKRQSCVQCGEVLELFDLAQSTMSHHLKLLVEADLLISEKEGRNLKFVINKDVCSAYSKFINNFGA